MGHTAMAGRGTARQARGWRPEARPLGTSELRIRVGGVELAVAGESREDCLRQLERAAREVDAETRLAETRWGLTDAGRRALGAAA
jgi:hypothetical protein